MSDRERLAKVAEVLAGHLYQGSYLSAWCSCEKVEPLQRDPETGRRPAVNVAALHRAHQADMLKPLLGEWQAEDETRDGGLRARCLNLLRRAELQDNMSLSCDFAGNRWRTPISQDDLRAALAAVEPDAGERDA